MKGEKETHYCRPDGNIPHDQTNQSPWWDAGAPQPCSNTPFHSLSATNTWSPINDPPRTCTSPLPHWFMADDFIITHPSLSLLPHFSHPEEECNELSINHFFHAPITDLAMLDDDYLQAFTRKLTPVRQSLATRANGMYEITLENWEGGACPGMDFASSEPHQRRYCRLVSDAKQLLNNGASTGRMEQDKCRRGILIPFRQRCWRILNLTHETTFCKHSRKKQYAYVRQDERVVSIETYLFFILDMCLATLFMDLSEKRRVTEQKVCETNALSMCESVSGV